MLDSKILQIWRGRSHSPDRCPCCRKRSLQDLRTRLSAVFRSRKYQQFVDMTDDDPWSAALRAVLAKAASDADFRAKCLNDASAAMKEVSGLDVVGLTFTDGNDGTGVALPPFGTNPAETSDGAACQQSFIACG